MEWYLKDKLNNSLKRNVKKTVGYKGNKNILRNIVNIVSNQYDNISFHFSSVGPIVHTSTVKFILDEQSY
uniref:Uncharacterized protein n=1 Tax=Arundo donax TaxID=35708 RepID=A0A0A9BIE5_ARUDO